LLKAAFVGAGVFVPFSGGPDIKIPHILELCKPFLTLFLEFVNSHKLEGTFLFRYDRLEELIKGSGKSKIYLCKKMNLGPTYLRDAKKQNSNIKDEPLRILAEELNTTPEYLRGETDDPGIKKAPGINAEGLSAARKALLDAVDGLTDEQCEKLLGIVLEAKRVL
jgi:transcriptional regulator with XRE-family HTH domain